MGRSYHVKCLQCGNNFDVNSGGGFFFHLLHCDFCGKDKSIGFDEIGELHLRYIKGLPGPYCVASSSLDQHIKDNYPGEPMSEGEYHAAVEQIAAACDCESRRVGPGSAGEASLADKLATGEANIVGSQEKLIDFLSLMDNFEFWFNIVTP